MRLKAWVWWWTAVLLLTVFGGCYPAPKDPAHPDETLCCTAFQPKYDLYDKVIYARCRRWEPCPEAMP